MTQIKFNFNDYINLGKYTFKELTETTMKKYQEYGPIVRDDIINRRAVWMFDPHDIQIVFRNDGKEPERQGLDSLRVYKSMNKEAFGDGGLLVNNGKTWSRIRFKSQATLLKPNVLNDYLPNICSAAEALVTKLEEYDNNKNGIDVELFYKWALESIVAVLLNIKLGSLERNPNSDVLSMVSVVSQILENCYKLDFDPFSIWRWRNKPIGKRWKNFIHCNETFVKIATKYIDIALIDAEHNQNLNSVIAKLLLKTELNRKDAISLMLDFIMAGIDSTAHAVIFNLFYLSKNMTCQESVFREICFLFSNSCDSLTRGDLQSLHYLRACIKETHRLMPVVVGTNRVLRKDIVCKGYHIPAGTLIITTNLVPCRLEKYFHEPLVFNPERWIRNNNKINSLHTNNNNNNNVDIHPFLILPFGFGPRTCIGKRIAELEIMVLLAKVLFKYRIEYYGDEDHLQVITKFINVPVGPLKFKFIPRC